MKVYKQLAFLIANFLFVSLGFAQSISSAEVEVTTMQKGQVVAKVSRTLIPGGEVYTVDLSNQSGKDQNLSWIDVTVKPASVIPANTTYMVGSDEMLRHEGDMYRLQTGEPVHNKNNNTYLLFRNNDSGYLLIGVITWRTFLCQLFEDAGIVHVNGDGDNKLLQGRGKLQFEKIVCLRSASWQDILENYANLIAAENNVPMPPKVSWKGWASWDYYRQYFTPDAVKRNTEEMTKLNAGVNIIQIDGGWWKQRGDYFASRDNLPGGIKALVENIHKAGYKAGLHFDGFRASSGATIVKEHSEYFVHTTSGSLLELDRDKVTGDPLVVWDYSHPGAQQYITAVMRNAREAWGVDYFKIDFMRQGLSKGVNHLPVTNVERYRMGIKAMKKGIKDVYFLACSANFGVNIGLVGATRTGPDIDPAYESVVERAQHNSANYYFAPKLYNCDPDYLVVRSAAESDSTDRKKPSLSYDEAEMWSNYVSIFGNVRLASDELRLLSQEKKGLIKKTFSMPFFERTIPMDWWDHFTTENDAPSFYLAKGSDGTICLGLFNWEDEQKTFSISGFKTGATLKELGGAKTLHTVAGSVSCSLKGVHSVLLQYRGKESFDFLRKSLKLTVNKQ